MNIYKQNVALQLRWIIVIVLIVTNSRFITYLINIGRFECNNFDTSIITI